MMNKISHRGPDDEGFFISQPDHIALGHKRLSIIDIKGGKQPFLSIDENYIIIFNGEIYNFKSLRSQLVDYDFKGKF